MRAVNLELWRAVGPEDWDRPFVHPECGTIPGATSLGSGPATICTTSPMRAIPPASGWIPAASATAARS